MKKNLAPILILLAFLMGFSANAQQTETRKLDRFTKVESGGSWDVFITLGNAYEVKIEAQNVDLDKVLTEVKDGQLKLKLERGNYRNVRLKFYVTMPEIEGLGSSGSGSITVMDDLESEKLGLGVSGSGLIKLQKVYAYSMSVGISGSGDIVVDGGEVEKLDIGQSGSGDFEGMDLKAQQVTIGKSGSGETYITAIESLKVGASGSGNVYYKGVPTKQIGTSGSAKVIKR